VVYASLPGVIYVWFIRVVSPGCTLWAHSARMYTARVDNVHF